MSERKFHNFHWARLLCTALSVFTVSVFSVSSARAANPDLNRLTPYGAKQGDEVTVTFSGNRLEDAEEIVTFKPGLEITEVTPVEDKNGKQVTARVKVLEDAPLGRHRLRLRTRTGISEVVAFFVGTLPVVDEKEPNTDFETPQEIENNVTVHGRIDNEDVDHFAVKAKKGERLSVEVIGLRMGTQYAGRNFFDPYVAIMNQDRFELDARDDHALTRQDAFASIIVPEDGTYVIKLRDASYGGHGAALYQLHIGNFPRPTATVPSGGKPGETINVKFYGDVTGEFEQQIQIPTDASEDFGIFASQNGSVAPTRNHLRVSSLPNTIEQEPNENREQATEVSIPGAANGILLTEEDTDYFKMNMSKNQQVELDVIARRVRSSLDSVIDVYNADGRRLEGDNDRKRPDSWCRFKAPEDGTYYFRVRDHLGNGGKDYHYRVEVTPIEPSMSIEPNDIARYTQPDIELPRGRRVAVLASIRRQNFGGAVKFITENLPEGIRLESPESWSETGVVPLMFDADKEADLQTALPKVIGQWTNPKNEDQVVSANVEQSILKVRGRNNNYLWTEDFEVLPVTVIEEVPFDLEIVEPKVPLVRGGRMDLKVVATRAEGFDEEIDIRILQNPPGVNSSRSVKIKKGETEATIPVNASGNAPIKTSAITVTGQARVGNGNITVHSPFKNIEVADQYLNLEYVSSAVVRGESVNFPVTVDIQTEFEGKAQVKLLGLPANTKTEEREITKETKEIVFPITTEEKAQLGEHKNLFCEVVVMENGEPIAHRIGKGRLRINKPAPVLKKKPEEEKKKEEKKPEPPKKKVLSRLEQLRQQQEELRDQLN